MIRSMATDGIARATWGMEISATAVVIPQVSLAMRMVVPP